MKVLQVSKSLRYQLGPDGAVDGSVKLDGKAIDRATSCRIVTSNSLQGGGDGFAAFTKGTDVYYGGLDIDAFASYLSAHSPYAPTALDRITR